MLTGLEGESYIDFGAPNTSAMSNPRDLVYLDIEYNSEWWTSSITGFKWDVEDATEFKIERTYALTDTGQSCISGPKS